jgi:hypothetical protein
MNAFLASLGKTALARAALVWPLAAMAWLTTAAPLSAQEIQFPFIQALAWIPSLEGRVLPPGERSWEFTISDANIFSFTHDFEAINDLSVLAFCFSHRRPLSRSLTLEVSGGFRGYYDGGLDQFIKKVDSALGYSDSGRDVFPEKTIHYKYKDRFYYTRNRWAPSPLVIGLATRIRRFGAVDLNGRLGLGIPLSDLPGISSKRPYLLAGVMGEYDRDKVSVSASLLAVYFDRPGWLSGEDSRRHYFQSEVKATLSRWVLGVILRSSPLTFSENANTGRMMYIAFRFKNGIEIGLMEDLPPMDTVPDVAMYVKLDLHPGHK